MSSSPAEEDVISGCDFQTVLKVVDGDTFKLSDETKVRLIGVDTPETVDPRKDVQWFGREASKKLKEWIEGETVCLRKDMDKTQDSDKYGRLLRYVWKYNIDRAPSDKAGHAEVFFVNAELVKQGYAFSYTRYPFQYLDDFRIHEKRAREKGAGLWNSKRKEEWETAVKKSLSFADTCGEDNIICPQNAATRTGDTVTVRFFVKKSYDSGKAIFLNSKNNFQDSDNFTAVIFSKDMNNFPPSSADYYWGKTVDITGTIIKYRGRPEIILKSSSQIKIVNE